MITLMLPLNNLRGPLGAPTRVYPQLSFCVFWGEKFCLMFSVDFSQCVFSSLTSNLPLGCCEVYDSRQLFISNIHTAVFHFSRSDFFPLVVLSDRNASSVFRTTALHLHQNNNILARCDGQLSWGGDISVVSGHRLKVERWRRTLTFLSEVCSWRHLSCLAMRPPPAIKHLTLLKQVSTRPQLQQHHCWKLSHKPFCSHCDLLDQRLSTVTINCLHLKQTHTCLEFRPKETDVRPG